MAGKYSDFEALRPQLLSLARLMLRDVKVRVEAEDLVQTVLTEIYAKLEAGAEIKCPQAYANCALKNRLVDEMRRFHNKLEREWPTQGDEDQAWEPIDPGAIAPDDDPALTALLAGWHMSGSGHAREARKSVSP